MFEQIKNAYYYLIPYEYRLENLWYKLKCYIFRPYTTIKPRYLPHTWVDKDNILVHAIFEILSLYLEKEKPDEVVDWEWDPEYSQAWKDINELYHWWHETYVPWTKSNRDHQTNEEYNREDERMRLEVNEKCKKVIELKDYLWT